MREFWICVGWGTAITAAIAVIVATTIFAPLPMAIAILIAYLSLLVYGNRN